MICLFIFKGPLLIIPLYFLPSCQGSEIRFSLPEIIWFRVFCSEGLLLENFLFENIFILVSFLKVVFLSVHSLLAVFFSLLIDFVPFYSGFKCCWKICNPCNCHSFIGICCFIIYLLVLESFLCPWCSFALSFWYVYKLILFIILGIH